MTSTLAICALALYGVSGLSGPAILVAIPNLVVLICSGFAVVVCWIKRPRLREIRRSILIGTLATSLLMLSLIFWEGLPFGYYYLRIQVINAEGTPISGIKISALGQKTGHGVMDTFVPNDIRYSAVTDELGIAFIRASKYEFVNGLVNFDFRHESRDLRFRSAEFSIRPKTGGDVAEEISWSRNGKAENANMHTFGTDTADPGGTILRVFLPSKGGSDAYNPQ